MIMTAPLSLQRADPVITSRTNKRVADLVRLRLPRHRQRTGTFLIEGYRELARALPEVDLQTVYYCPSLWLHRHEAELLARARRRGAELVELAAAPFHRISYRDRPDGLLAVGRIFGTALDRLPITGPSDPSDPLLLVVERIEKPGNLGAMLRTACAAGVTGMIICDPATDPFGPGVVRASLGHLFAVPLAITDTDTALAWLDRHRIRIVAGTPAGSVASWDADLTGPTALVIGSEQHGLSDRWVSHAQIRTRIPMVGGPDSLNAATAAGVLLFEAARQRADPPAIRSDGPSNPVR
ncbi:TrmH family RNA methyltransferase [Microlunatus speluncae]|uniref:TrmH family RNA methyltransferase n=1 Tax=Microlunatus speluncae TaxID=2594267 RepID=UPI001C2DDC80|nr:TrmH family RNA methyltransferase [Microlunatus speluncae]